MGSYVVRYKGKRIKGAAVDVPLDDEEDEAEELPVAEKKKPKMKIGAPEKDVVAKVFGVKNAKKELAVGEKGSSKSGNYGHAGRPGKRGGSMPKGTGVVGGGAASAPKDADAERQAELLRISRMPFGNSGPVNTSPEDKARLAATRAYDAKYGKGSWVKDDNERYRQQKMDEYNKTHPGAFANLNQPDTADLDKRISELKMSIRDQQDRRIPRGLAYDFQREVRSQYLKGARSQLAALEREKTKLTGQSAAKPAAIKPAAIKPAAIKPAAIKNVNYTTTSGRHISNVADLRSELRSLQNRIVHASGSEQPRIQREITKIEKLLK